nr:immunoglobulin heavy chain junction region [Mus musculus]MBK4184086.1 immunoglobulin heavy chain junction region [Mus musculus]MBK4184087.1 immunoglobulin heavy chain junction region [Mus musculus]
CARDYGSSRSFAMDYW